MLCTSPQFVACSFFLACNQSDALLRTFIHYTGTHPVTKTSDPSPLFHSSMSPSSSCTSPHLLLNDPKHLLHHPLLTLNLSLTNQTPRPVFHMVVLRPPFMSLHTPGLFCNTFTIATGCPAPIKQQTVRKYIFPLHVTMCESNYHDQGLHCT